MMGWEESFFKCPYLASAGPDDSWRHWLTEHQQIMIKDKVFQLPDWFMPSNVCQIINYISCGEW